MSASHRSSVESTVSSVFFLALISVVLLQVAGRSGIFDAFVWTEELARWLWVWLALIGLGEVERSETHLRMTFLIDLLPARARRALVILFDLIWLLAMCQLAWIAWKTVQRTLRNESVTLMFNDWVLYAAFLVGSVFVIFRLLQRLATQWRGDTSGPSASGPSASGPPAKGPSASHKTPAPGLDA